jgi:hypothetical protein
MKEKRARKEKDEARVRSKAERLKQELNIKRQ